jgi:hypothetical protein
MTPGLQRPHSSEQLNSMSTLQGRRIVNSPIEFMRKRVLLP